MMFSNRSRVFCPDEFFRINDVMGTQLKLSECFQLSLLSVPSLIFVITVCIWFPILRTRKQPFITNIKFGWVQKLRLVIVINLTMCSLIFLVSTAVTDYLDSTVQFGFIYYVSPSLNIISLIIYALLMENQRRAHQPRSELLFTYIFSLFICALPRFYGITASPHSEDFSMDSGTIFGKIYLCTFSIYICLIFAELLTHFFSPHNRGNSLLQDKNACSELWVSVPCLWTFNWITSTILKAYRGKISTTDDLFHITPENSVKFNYERFNKSWIKSTHLWLRKSYNSYQSEVIVDDNFQDDKAPLFTAPIISTASHSNNSKSIIPHNQNNIINIPEVRVVSSSSTLNSFENDNQKCNSTTNLCQSNDDGNRKQKNIFYTWILIYSLLTIFGLRLLIGWTLLFIGVLFNFSAPLLLGKLLQFLSNPNAPLWHGYAIASTLLCLQLVSAIMSQRGFHKCLSLGVAVRSTLTSAVYRKRRDIYLMDDPLSAVDSHVGKHLFDHVLGPNGLLKEKTRIITTNSFHILKSTDWIILLDKDGTIAHTGTYKDMIDLPSGQFADFINSIQTKSMNTHKSNCLPSLNKDIIGSEMKTESSSVSKSLDHNLETGADISNLDISHSSLKDNVSLTETLSRSPPHNVLKKLSFDVPDSCTSFKRMYVDLEPQISHTSNHMKQNENFAEQEIEIEVETPTELAETKSNHDIKQHTNFQHSMKLNDNITTNIISTNIAGCSINGSDNSSQKNSINSDDSSTNLRCVDRNMTSKSDDNEIGGFINEEEISHGRVPWLAYWNYFVARGLLLLLTASVVYSFFLTIQAFSNYWLQWFADDKDIILAEKALKNQSIILNDTARYFYLKQIKSRTYYYIFGYACIGLGQILSVVTYVLMNAYSSVRASKIIHHQLLTHVLHASIIFFDHTPLGYILNRFSMDIDNLDHNIPSALLDVIACFGDLFIALVIVMLSLYPIGIGIIIVMPLLFFCIILLLLYLPCARQSRRLDALTRSPLLCNFNETAVSSLGVTIVRTFKLTEKFIQLSDELIDINAVNEFLRYTSNRWLDIYLNLFCDLVVFSCGLLVITYRSTISAGLAGLVIIYALQIAETFTWVVKQLSQLETAAVSLERIREYTTQIDQEGDWDHGPDSKYITSNWPRPCCEIIFNKTTVQYCLSRKQNSKRLINNTNDHNNDDINEDSSNTKKNIIRALKSIDLKLSGNYDERRIGIVGRTGAGKSSLANALFRLVEPTVLGEDQFSSSSKTTLKQSTNSGPIIVDGIDLSRIGLHELRSRFSILPQEPIIFAGTLRFNLDPFNHRTDEELWTAIRAAHLMDWIQSNNVNLDYECGEGGSNLSAGQRQLVCLARVFLSSGGRVRLLILDEATSAMDPVTDNLVMNTVMGEKFHDATIIIIAHRLSTVMNTDKIVVLDHGQVVEVGHPKELLKKSNSYFAKMNKIRHL